MLTGSPPLSRASGLEKMTRHYGGVGGHRGGLRLLYVLATCPQLLLPVDLRQQLVHRVQLLPRIRIYNNYVYFAYYSKYKYNDDNDL